MDGPNQEQARRSPILAYHLYPAALKRSTKISRSNLIQPEPRWPPLLAVLAGGLLNLALPDWVSVGPRGLLLGIVAVLSSATFTSHCLGRRTMERLLAYANNLVLTLGMLGSLGYLVHGMPTHHLDPQGLLVSAASLWMTNILVFSIWYWRLDAGGPHRRERREGHPDGAFLFAQMSMAQKTLWSPGFIDYLFLSFNTSTALSPTDVPVLSGWAKALMMTQSLISLMIVVLLVARAINTL